MKGKQTALMPGNEDEVGYWLTPEPLKAALRAEFGELWDPCPFPRPAGYDGLVEPWPDVPAYVNPPFSDHKTQRWVRRAIAHRDAGNMAVLILPITGWIEAVLEAGGEIRLVGRVPWLNPAGKATARPRWASALFILRPKSVHPKSDEQPPRQEARSPPSDGGGDEQT